MRRGGIIESDGLQSIDNVVYAFVGHTTLLDDAVVNRVLIPSAQQKCGLSSTPGF